MTERAAEGGRAGRKGIVRRELVDGFVHLALLLGADFGSRIVPNENAMPAPGVD